MIQRVYRHIGQTLKPLACHVYGTRNPCDCNVLVSELSFIKVFSLSIIKQVLIMAIRYDASRSHELNKALDTFFQDEFRHDFQRRMRVFSFVQIFKRNNIKEKAAVKKLSSPFVFPFNKMDISKLRENFTDVDTWVRRIIMETDSHTHLQTTRQTHCINYNMINASIGLEYEKLIGNLVEIFAIFQGQAKRIRKKIKLSCDAQYSLTKSIFVIIYKYTELIRELYTQENNPAITNPFPNNWFRCLRKQCKQLRLKLLLLKIFVCLLPSQPHHNIQNLVK